MKKELLAILLLFLVVLTSVSILSHSPLDPSINHQSFTTENIHNLFGLVGAHLSGVIVDLFGVASLWLPMYLFLAALWYFRGKQSLEIAISMAGGLIIICATAGILSIIRDRVFINGGYVASGGFVGGAISDFLLEYTNTLGSVTILVFFIFSGVVLTTGISAFTLILIIRDYTFIALKFIGLKALETYNRFLSLNFIYKFVDPIKNGFLDLSKLQAVKDEILKPIKEAKLLPTKDKKDKDKKDKKVASHVNNIGDDAYKEGLFKDQDSSFKEDFVLSEDGSFILPPLYLLNDNVKLESCVDISSLNQKGEILENKFKDFGVKGEIVNILPGPVITTFEYRPAPGVKISKIANLSDDLALALSALSIRIVAPIPGKDVVGIEIPNERREPVFLKEILSSEEFLKSKSSLTLALGKDILGVPVSSVMDSMPHLLIAGATGTGKSVGLNSMIISLLYKAKPDEVKFIMVDPKRIELSVYDGIPHLISPVVTDMKKATNALFWAVKEMDRRYELLAQCGVRNLLQYNKIDKSDNQLESLPYIVIIVDEFADLMMVASKDVETALIRLAQMARAAGIHLILATQRPSVDVLTGIIKANFPTRISFQVSSKTDSRTILDTNGSERLLGNGDMLFLPPGTGRLQRIQGAYISEDEIAKVTFFLKEQQQPDYVEDITEQLEDNSDSDKDDFYDEKYDEAVALVAKTRQASISSVQRHLRIGYNRAARIIETMEKKGLVGPQDGSKPREVLMGQL
ncbi:MAG: DNA translocase FtsK 4TM domain-containing protein [Desulfamplus sp.]|nr:DNA translocase FtsK 4TM domain-containing protein [Desulfamplus sp.]